MLSDDPSKQVSHGPYTPCRPYTGPTDIRFEQGRLHIDGYPDAERVVKVDTPAARRLADLRLHENALVFCEAAMQEFRRLRPVSKIGADAILIGVIAKYFSCFGHNQASASLNANSVFKGMADARARFDEWKYIRDSHVIHDQSELTFLTTGAVLGPGAEVQDIVSFRAVSLVTDDEDHQQILYNLVHHTLAYVRGEITRALARVFDDMRSMSPSQRSALPDLIYNAPKAGDDLGGIRRR